MNVNIEKTIENKNEDKMINLFEELNSIRRKESMEFNYSITELDEIGDKIVETKAKLQAYTLKNEEKGMKKMFRGLPIFKQILNKSQQIIDKNEDIGELLNQMIRYFDKKYDVIIERIEDFEKLSIKIETDIKELNNWINKREEEKLSTTIDSKILKIDKMITIAKMDRISKEETLYNKIKPSITAAKYLGESINVLSPILNNVLKEELAVTSGINSFKDASNMLIELKTLVVDLKKINNNKMESMIVDTLTNANTSLFTSTELEELLEMSETSKKNISKHAKKISDMTIDSIENMRKIENKYNSKPKEEILIG